MWPQPARTLGRVPHPAERAASALLAHAPLTAPVVDGLLRRQPWVVTPLARNPRLSEPAWRELYSPTAGEDVAATLVNRPLSSTQAHFALVTRRERRERPVELLIRHGSCPLPTALVVELLDGPAAVRSALAVVDWVPSRLRAKAAASVPAQLLRPVEPAALARLHGEFTAPVTIDAAEYSQVVGMPVAALALLPWRLQRAAADLAAQACQDDGEAWDTLLRLMPRFTGTLGALLAAAPAIAA